ncbi:MAG TPA: rod shape-determining protein MreD [Herpetosiphonaceae bacterium]
MGDYRPKIEQRIARQMLRALMLLSLALAQTALAPTFWRFRADWVLIAVIGWTILRGLIPGVRWALYGGLSLDLLGVMPVGSHLLALLICVIGVALVTEPLDREQPLLVIVAILAASVLYGSILALLLTAQDFNVPWRYYTLIEIFPTAIINTILAIPTFALLRRLYKRGQPTVEA